MNPPALTKDARSRRRLASRTKVKLKWVRFMIANNFSGVCLGLPGGFVEKGKFGSASRE